MKLYCQHNFVFIVSTIIFLYFRLKHKTFFMDPLKLMELSICHKNKINNIKQFSVALQG